MSTLQNHETPVKYIEEQPEFFLLDETNRMWKLVTPGLILFIVWISLSGVMNG